MSKHGQTLTKYLILIFTLSILSSKCIFAQTKGTYITLDQNKEIHFLDSNKIVIKEVKLDNFEEIEIKGTYKIRMKRLIVVPSSLSSSDKNKIIDTIPNRIVYKLKYASNQKFRLKKVGKNLEWDKFYLEDRIQKGIQ